MAKKFYVVWQGRKPGIYTDWNQCKQQVEKFPGARYKSFLTFSEAQAAFKGTVQNALSKKEPSGLKRVKLPTVKTYSAAEIKALSAPVKLFTDGGCEPNPGEAGSGMALYRNNTLETLWYGLYTPQGTNNTAELNALNQALIQAKKEQDSGMTKVVIFCDSKYAIQCITQWAEGWQKNGWKRAGGEIKNLSLIQEIFKRYQILKSFVQILHVNGHVGVEGNELADRMSIWAIQVKETEFVEYSDVFDIERILAIKLSTG